MAEEKTISREDWLHIEDIVSNIIGEDAWDMCSRDFLEAVEKSIEEGENLAVNTKVGGDECPVPLSVQAIPYALSAVFITVKYYKKHGKLPSSAEEFLKLVPTNRTEVSDFILDNFPTMLSIIMYTIQIA